MVRALGQDARDERDSVLMGIARGLFLAMEERG